MAKFNAKNLAIVVFLGMFLVGVTGLVYAQEALPKGGDGFENAVKIELGSYQGGSLGNKEKEYFYVTDIKPGQEVKVKTIFTPDGEAIASIDLYDENRMDLANCYDSGKNTDIPCEVSWLTNSDRESYKYYIRPGSDLWGIASYLLDISLTNYYDANSQTDAGDTFEKAMDVTSGEYEAYLSGEKGTDTKDFYKLAVEKGKTLTVKVTPPTEAVMTIVVYDGNRAELNSEYASNPGAIITNSVAIEKSGNVFVAVLCDTWCSENLVAYTLDITTEGVPIGEEEEEEEEGVFPDAELGMFKGLVKKVLNWALILGIIVGIVIIGMVAYFLLKKKRTPPPPPSNQP